MRSVQIKGILFILVAVTLYALMDTFARGFGLYSGLHPWQVAAMRGVVGFLVTFVVALQRGLRLTYVSERLKWHVLRGFLGSLIIITTFWALRYIPMVEKAALSFSNVLFQTIIAMLILREKLTLSRLGGTLLGFLGVGLVMRAEFASLTFGIGSLLALAAALMVSVMAYLIKVVAVVDAPVKTWCLFNLFVLPVTLIPGLYFWEPVASLTEWVGLIVLGLCGVGAQYFMIKAYSTADMSVIAPFNYLIIVMMGGIGYATFGEVPRWEAVVGALVIIMSTGYLAWQERRDRSDSGFASTESS